MKFEGIEIALEGIWYKDNHWTSVRGRGEGKEKYRKPLPDLCPNMTKSLITANGWNIYSLIF